MRTAKRALRTSLLLMMPAAIVGSALFVAKRHQAHAANDLSTTCISNLTNTTYPSGVASASLATNTAIAVKPGTGLQLDTNLAPFNAQNITLPFDQAVDVKYVYRNAGASHSFGWFYLDQIQPFLNTDGTLKDADGDGIYDWFQDAKGALRPNQGLWKMTNGTSPDMISSTYNYGDGGNMPHVPNTLETLTTAGKGMWLFKLCDDDGDYSVYGVGSTVGSYPITDGSPNSDGIPDYDVNGDGTIANEADRTVQMGTVQGNRELVFFAITYYDSQLPQKGLGMNTTSTGQASKVMPFFTKNILNPDRGILTPGQRLDRVAIKCKPLESGGDPTCYSQYSPAATNGWLTPEAQARLNTATYGYVNISNDPSVYNINVAADGSGSHFVVLPPASNPNLWLIGYEDLANNVADNDFNDVVFMVERQNGGQVVSNVISNIPAAQQATTAISTLHITYAATFPSPGCDGVAGTGAQVKLYWSVDNGVTWNAVPMASLTSGDVTIDVLGMGVIGSQLKWRADFISPSQTCQPALTSLNIGYDAVSNGIFKYAAPIPLANMVYDGALETPPYPATETQPTRGDYSLRGHFFANQLYDETISNPVTLNPPPLMWDSGALMSAASSNPNSRYIITSTGTGTTTTFDTTNGSTLYQLLLPTATRTLLNSATLVYDYTGDGVVDDKDAQHLLQWTRGWEYASGLTYTPAATPLMRAWRLGSVHNSSPAIVSPPVRPDWIDGTAAPALLVGKHNLFRAFYQERPTISIVGAQDGMLHGFASGGYIPQGDSKTTDCPSGAQSLVRGCFGSSSTPGTANYGTGAELWAWLPPSQLSQLKNNTPVTKGYNPGSNPKAEIDGSVSLEDVWDATAQDFHTVAYASLGTTQRYITAVEISPPIATVTPASKALTALPPKAIWANDWTDADFNGSDFSPSVALVKQTAAPGYREMIVTSSGLSALAADQYIYEIDALTGTLVQKLKLNTGAYATQTTGFGSYVNLVDADADGLVDRAYAADTSGRIWKVDLTTNTSCMIASVGETVYAGMAVVSETSSSATAPKIELFVGGGSNPDGTGTSVSQYHLFSLEDDDLVGTCKNVGTKIVATQALPAGYKMWAAPTVTVPTATSAGTVYLAATNAGSDSVCATGTSNLYGASTDATGTSSLTTPLANLGSAAISSLRVYDGHAMVNTVGGGTTVVGASTWNNKSTDPNAATGTQIGLINQMRTLMWQEL